MQMMQGWFIICKSIYVVHQQKVKPYNHCNRSKKFFKNSIAFYFKSPQQINYRKKLPQHSEGYM